MLMGACIGAVLSGSLALLVHNYPDVLLPFEMTMLSTLAAFNACLLVAFWVRNHVKTQIGWKGSAEMWSDGNPDNDWKALL